MEIQGTCKGAELNKRQGLPGITITDQCPKCKVPYTMDLSDRYLSYPVVGAPTEVDGYCRECGHEWSLGFVTIRMSLEAVTEKGDPIRTPEMSLEKAGRVVADALEDIESPLREAVRAQLGPDECSHEDADDVFLALEQVLRGKVKA